MVVIFPKRLFFALVSLAEEQRRRGSGLALADEGECLLIEGE
jgi:hypothetical protein